MIRLTVISLAGLVGVLMAFEEPAVPSGTSSASGVDEVVTEPEERVTLRRISQPESLRAIESDDDHEPTQIIQAAAPVITNPMPAATVQGTVVHRVGAGQTHPDMIQIISLDAPADARTRPTPHTAANGNDSSTVRYVSGSRVNLRAGPSTSSRIVVSLTRNTPVELIGVDGAWARLRVVNTGAEGFMAQRFLHQ